MRAEEKKRREEYRKKLDALQSKNHDTIEDLKKQAKEEMQGDEDELQKMKTQFKNTEEGK